MENLIKIQALINQIEDATLEQKYHSNFEYLDNEKMIIETSSEEQTINYMLLFAKMKNTEWYIRNNYKIKVIDLSNN